MSLRIVVIDDDECIRESFKWHLEDLGHKVHTAPSPVSCDVYQGHSCSREEPCADVLLIDFNMPGMNGLDFIKRLAQRGCKGMRSNILLMSGNIQPIDNDVVNQIGCTVYQKPLSFAKLEEWLASRSR